MHCLGNIPTLEQAAPVEEIALEGRFRDFTFRDFTFVSQLSF